MVLSSYIEQVGLLLKNENYPLKQRFRALYTLKNLGGATAIDCIVHAFSDKSSFLKHELAYCLGQMKDKYAIPALLSILEDENQPVVVRHEAAEAISAIGDVNLIPALQKFQYCNIPVLAETCILGVKRLEYLANGGKEVENIYNTIDPTPPLNETDIQRLKTIFLDENKQIFERYQAMFALRNLNSDESVRVLNLGLTCGSALFRHEVAFVLGQLKSPLSVSALGEVAANKNENDIVRHESIDALGSIGSQECIEIIKRHVNDGNDLVKESCLVGLDMCDYENSSEFQYANGLEMIENNSSL